MTCSADRSSGRGGELHAAMGMIGQAGRGVVVLIREPLPTSLSDRVKARLAGEPPHPATSLRDYGVGAQILLDLGVREMILLSNTKRTIVGLEGYGLTRRRASSRSRLSGRRVSGKPHLLIVEARFYADIADELLKGAIQALDEAGATHERVSVPGAFEIPAAIAMTIEAQRVSPPHRSFDGYLALGCVIRGETTHYDYVCRRERPRADGSDHPAQHRARLRHPDRRKRRPGLGSRAGEREEQGRRCRARLSCHDRSCAAPGICGPADGQARHRRHPRSTARLAAVQALYQLELSGGESNR